MEAPLPFGPKEPLVALNHALKSKHRQDIIDFLKLHLPEIKMANEFSIGNINANKAKLEQLDLSARLATEFARTIDPNYDPKYAERDPYYAVTEAGVCAGIIKSVISVNPREMIEEALTRVESFVKNQTDAAST